MSERVLFCVDIANLWDACRTKFGQSSRIDFEVLKNIYPSMAKDEIGVYHPTAYIVTHRRATHGSFTEVLMALGYQVKESCIDYVVVDSRPVSMHDDWSVGITVDAVHNMESYDTFVIATGVSQYKHLLNFLRDNGKKVVVLTFETEQTQKLYEGAETLFLSEDIVYG